MGRLSVFLFLFLAGRAFAQFTPALLQNNSYWGDGKAEFNIYDAQIVRYGFRGNAKSCTSSCANRSTPNNSSSRKVRRGRTRSRS